MTRPFAQPGSQLAFLEARWCPEIFIGGNRGGGKGYAHCLYQADGATRYGPKYGGIMTRKTFPELEQLMLCAGEVFGYYGARYHVQPSADRPVSNAWYWPNGAITRMRYLEREEDYGRYHGHELTHASFDEVTEYANLAPILKMFSTLRSPHGVPCTMRASGNPGGVGHQVVKQRYIDVAPPLTAYRDPDTGLDRMFIPSRLDENVILTSKDPDYRKRLLVATAGNDALRKAWIDGDWDVVAGAFFSGWDRARHVIRPFTIPAHWVRIRGFDFGSGAPFSVLWAAVSDGERLPDGRLYPNGALVVYREWYGAKDGQDNVGLHMDAEEIARGIKERTPEGEKIDYSVSDPACWKREGGPSIAYRMSTAGFPSKEGDNSRIAGWDQIRGRLTGLDAPMLYIMDSCVKLIAHLPLLQTHPLRIEDADTKGLDHDCDALRYLCMSWPWSRPEPKKPDLTIVHTGWKFSDLRKRNVASVQ